MKITVEHYDETISVAVTGDDLTFDEYLELIRKISVSIYSEETWNKWLNS